MAAKRSVLTKEEFVACINEMSDDQFKDFSKEHNREVRDMMLWKDGEQHIARSAFRLANDIINKVTQIEELEAYISDHPDDMESIGALSSLKFEMESAFDDMEGKIDSFCAVVKLIQRDAERYDAMADLFKKKSSQAENRAKRVKERMCAFLQAVNLEEVQGSYFKVKLGKPTYSVQINDMNEEEIEALPDQFLRKTVAIDKTAVKAALMDKEDLPWAVLVPSVGIRIT